LLHIKGFWRTGAFGIISVMANLPVPAPTESSTPALNPVQASIAQAIFDGLKPGEIARKMAPDDPKRRKVIRRRVRAMVKSDPVFQNYIGELAKGHLIMSLGTAVRGLERAAGRGRSDAIKLLFEATGFHATKTKHEHSGSIEVKVSGVPRPEPVVEEPVPDAEVVE
jgi:hypothetical protein